MNIDFSSKETGYWKPDVTNSFRLKSVDLSAYAGVIFTGANVAWCVDEAKALPLQQTMEAAFMAEKPVFGSCNGMQLAAVVLGRQSSAMPADMEIGLALNIDLTALGHLHPMHSGREDQFTAFALHRDHVSKLPEVAVVTASNARSPIQAMAYEQGNSRFWGTQYHPEYILSDIIDCVSDAGSMFNSDVKGLDGLCAEEQNSAVGAAKGSGAYGDDMQPSVLRTELSNWVQSLSLTGLA